MKASDTQAHISIHDVKPGQKVFLYKSVCRATNGERGTGGRACRREQISEGIVTRIFNEHYSEAEFPKGVNFSEGDFVETVR